MSSMRKTDEVVRLHQISNSGTEATQNLEFKYTDFNGKCSNPTAKPPSAGLF